MIWMVWIDVHTMQGMLLRICCITWLHLHGPIIKDGLVSRGEIQFLGKTLEK